jgi:hypothetical protein
MNPCWPITSSPKHVGLYMLDAIEAVEQTQEVAIAEYRDWITQRSWQPLATAMQREWRRGL